MSEAVRAHGLDLLRQMIGKEISSNADTVASITKVSLEKGLISAASPAVHCYF